MNKRRSRLESKTPGVEFDVHIDHDYEIIIEILRGNQRFILRASVWIGRFGGYAYVLCISSNLKKK